MERLRKQLINKLEQSGIQVLDINLYDLALEILEHNGDLEWYISQEPAAVYPLSARECSRPDERANPPPAGRSRVQSVGTT